MSKIFCQRDAVYKKQKLGNSDLTLYDYGCYLFSLVNGLNQLFGWRFTPISFSNKLRKNNCFSKSNPAYIDPQSVTSLSSVFSGFERIEPLDTVQKIKDCVGKAVVLGRVSAKYIGGTGSHFVLILPDAVTAKKVTVIDPWDGKQKAFGISKIKGIRIYRCKHFRTGAEQEALDNKVSELSKKKVVTINKWVKTSRELQQMATEKKVLAYQVSEVTKQLNIVREKMKRLDLAQSDDNCIVKKSDVNFVVARIKWFVELFMNMFKVGK